MDKRSCQVLIDDIWEDCFLSDDEIQSIYDDMHGVSSKMYEITLNTGEIVEIGVIDDIYAD